MPNRYLCIRQGTATEIPSKGFEVFIHACRTDSCFLRSRSGKCCTADCRQRRAVGRQWRGCEPQNTHLLFCIHPSIIRLGWRSEGQGYRSGETAIRSTLCSQTGTELWSTAGSSRGNESTASRLDWHRPVVTLFDSPLLSRTVTRMYPPKVR